MIVQRHDAPRGFRAADNIFTGANTFSGITTFTGNIVAGTIDADFDDLTATTYGGIPEANLLDKTANESISTKWAFKQLYHDGAAEDKISLFSDRLGATNMYGLGVEASYMYFKTPTGYRWYSGANADGGTSDIMQLNASALNVNVAMTATSYGGIIEANLVDRIASEVITGAREWQGNVGFYSTTPIAKQTGVPVTAAGVHAALVNLGLIT